MFISTLYKPLMYPNMVHIRIGVTDVYLCFCTIRNVAIHNCINLHIFVQIYVSMCMSLLSSLCLSSFHTCTFHHAAVSLGLVIIAQGENLAQQELCHSSVFRLRLLRTELFISHEYNSLLHVVLYRAKYNGLTSDKIRT